MVTIVNDNRKRFRTICNHCLIELEYCKSDIKNIYRCGGDGWSYSYEYYEHYIICPECQKRIKINETELL